MRSKISPRNEHRIDRGFRVVLGLGLPALAFVGPKTAWGFIGIVPPATGLIGSCPAYELFDLRTCRQESC